METHSFQRKPSSTASRPHRPALVPHPLSIARDPRPDIRRILRGPHLQAKLTIGAPNDIYEQEADRVAELVMRMPDSQAQAAGGCRTAACSQVREEEGDGLIQTKALNGSSDLALQRQPDVEEAALLQTKQSAGHAAEVTPHLAAEIASMQGGGQPMSPSERAFFEPRFGKDFSQVRIHTGSQAAKAALAVNARAFTVGQDIVFGGERDALGTTEGQRLVAHELAHVVQQRTQIGFPAPWLARQDAQSGDGPMSAVAAGLNPMQAIHAIDDWRKKVEGLIDSTRVYHAHNWNRYYAFASGNPKLGLSDSQLAGIASNALGNSLTTFGPSSLEIATGPKLAELGSARALRASGAIGAGLGIEAGPLGIAIGYILGVFVESAASWLFENVTGKTDADEAAADASKRTADLLAAQDSHLSAEARKAFEETEKEADNWKLMAEQATTEATLEEIISLMQLESALVPDPPKEKDETLAIELLREWVLQHAGDEASSNWETSQPQWEGAVKYAFDANDLANKPGLFVHQCQLAWVQAGFDPKAETDAMTATVAKITAGAEDPAATVAGYFNRKAYTFTQPKNRDALIQWVDLWDLGIAQWLKEYIRTAPELKLTFTLALNTAKGTCYVDRWNCKLYVKKAESFKWSSLGVPLLLDAEETYHFDASPS